MNITRKAFIAKLAGIASALGIGTTAAAKALIPKSRNRQITPEEFEEESSKLAREVFAEHGYRVADNGTVYLRYDDANRKRDLEFAVNTSTNSRT